MQFYFEINYYFASQWPSNLIQYNEILRIGLEDE